MIDVDLNIRGIEEMVARFGGKSVTSFRAGSKVVDIPSAVRHAAVRGLTEAVAFLVGRARANAPRDTGALRNSITGWIGGQLVAGAGGDSATDAVLNALGEKLTARGRVTPVPTFSNRAATFEAQIKAFAPYAFFVHEFFIPEEPNGIQARVHDHTPEGGVGGGYLSRVIYYAPNRRRVLAFMADAVQATLQELADLAAREGLPRGSKVIGGSKYRKVTPQAPNRRLTNEGTPEERAANRLLAAQGFDAAGNIDPDFREQPGPTPRGSNVIGGRYSSGANPYAPSFQFDPLELGAAKVRGGSIVGSGSFTAGESRGIAGAFGDLEAGENAGFSVSRRGVLDDNLAIRRAIGAPPSQDAPTIRGSSIIGGPIDEEY